jgi:hypothetical protein
LAYSTPTFSILAFDHTNNFPVPIVWKIVGYIPGGVKPDSIWSFAASTHDIEEQNQRLIDSGKCVWVELHVYPYIVVSCSTIKIQPSLLQSGYLISPNNIQVTCSRHDLVARLLILNYFHTYFALFFYIFRYKCICF